MLLYNQAPFVGRANFGWFLNSRDLRGNGVEVGTHRGVFANMLLRSWDCRILYLVDPYESGYDPTDYVSGCDRVVDLYAMTELLKPHAHRYQLIKLKSVEAAGRLENDSLDFVYIDACHQEEAVFADLCAWWPKLRPGGLLAGHDIVEYGTDWSYKIQRALTRFERSLRTEQLLCELVVEPDGAAWSYFITKP